MLNRVLMLLGFLCLLAAAGQAQELKPGDILVTNRASVFIYESPGGRALGEVTRQDLRSNNDKIILKSTKVVNGQMWCYVLITGGVKTGPYPMPDTLGWFKARDISKSGSSQPYGAPRSEYDRLRTTIGVVRVIEGWTFVTVVLQTSYCGTLGPECEPVLRRHIEIVWKEKPGIKEVLIKDEAGKMLAESTSPTTVKIY